MNKVFRLLFVAVSFAFPIGIAEAGTTSYLINPNGTVSPYPYEAYGVSDGSTGTYDYTILDPQNNAICFSRGACWETLNTNLFTVSDITAVTFNSR
jgi:hypothetical protein